jgi:uncharacterized membrane-anchored protein
MINYGKRIMTLSLAWLVVTGLTGCGDDKTTSGDVTPPVIISASPANGLTEVSTNTIVSVTFSEEMNALTLNTSTFTLVNEYGETAGNVTYDSGAAIFTPSGSRLDLLASYTATVTTAAEDLAGNPMRFDHVWQFSTADGTWGTPQLIESDNTGTADSPQVAVDAMGNAFAVWCEWDGIRFNINANRYSAQSGTWGTPQLMESDDVGNALDPQIAVDASGNAFVVWPQSGMAIFNFNANRYSAQSGTWGTAQLIDSNNNGNAYGLQVAVDAMGNAFAVWNEWDGIRDNINANRYSVQSETWGTAQLIESDNAGDARVPQIAVDASGNAFAVWHQWDGTRYNINANRYSMQSGTWGTAQLIESDNTGNASNPQVAVDAMGNAFAVWYQWDGIRYNINANRYSAQSGTWGTAQLIESDNTGNAYVPQVAVDASGNAFAVWNQNDGTRFNINANRYSVQSGTWGTAQLIESDNTGGTKWPQVAVDAMGNTLAVWTQWDGISYNINANRYSAQSGTWGMAQLIEIESDNTGTAYSPQIAVDASGNAFVVWPQVDGIRNIYANRFE